MKISEIGKFDMIKEGDEIFIEYKGDDFYGESDYERQTPFKKENGVFEIEEIIMETSDESNNDLIVVTVDEYHDELRLYPFEFKRLNR